MPKYKCFFKSKVAEVEAESLYAAKLEALKIFRPTLKQQSLVAIVLVERDDGSEVIHSTSEI